MSFIVPSPPVLFGSAKRLRLVNLYESLGMLTCCVRRVLATVAASIFVASLLVQGKVKRFAFCRRVSERLVAQCYILIVGAPEYRFTIDVIFVRSLSKTRPLTVSTTDRRQCNFVDTRESRMERFKS
jgi:hypothetical protein